MKRIWSILLCLLICVSVFAKSQVNVIFENNDKSKVEKLYKLETMSDGAKRLTIPVCDIERGTKKVLVMSDDYQADKGDEGYFIFPSLMGNKILFKHNNNKYHSGQLQMPFWGAKTPKGTYVAIAKGLELEYSLVAEVKNGLHKLYPRYDIDDIDFDPYEDIVIDFYDLGKNATYVDMAKKYRKYQLDRGEVKPLRERVKNNPTLKYTVESPFIRVKLAHNKHPKGVGGFNSPKWDNITPELNIVHTFDSFIDVMRKIHTAGVKEADMCFVGWQVGGFDG
ncbi:MAG: hypothetical protein J6B07_07145, partial [Opitutales bacterium]|nr:hypothetical protein [Opitutales bacterium]